MNKQFNSTIIMVTHDPSAASFAQRVIMLKMAIFIQTFFNKVKQNLHFIMKSFNYNQS